MANIHYLRHLAQESLWDTIFFAAGEVPAKEKNKNFVQLKTKPLNVKIYSNRKILVNENRCNTINEAKLYIQYLIK